MLRFVPQGAFGYVLLIVVWFSRMVGSSSACCCVACGVCWSEVAVPVVVCVVEMPGIAGGDGSTAPGAWEGGYSQACLPPLAFPLVGVAVSALRGGSSFGFVFGLVCWTVPLALGY